MIGLSDCVRGIAAALETLLQVTPIARDSLDDIRDPGLYIVPVDILSERIGGNRHDTFQFVVAWYGNRATDRYIDLLDMQILLSDLLLRPIPVPGATTFLLFPEAVSFDLDAQEGTLFATFTIQNFQDSPDPAEEERPVVDSMGVEGVIHINV